MDVDEPAIANTQLGVSPFYAPLCPAMDLDAPLSIPSKALGLGGDDLFGASRHLNACPQAAAAAPLQRPMAAHEQPSFQQPATPMDEGGEDAGALPAGEPARNAKRKTADADAAAAAAAAAPIGGVWRAAGQPGVLQPLQQPGASVAAKRPRVL